MRVIPEDYSAMIHVAPWTLKVPLLSGLPDGEDDIFQ
jgi:hypothetical protein